jgi:hypothetical protein
MRAVAFHHGIDFALDLEGDPAAVAPTTPNRHRVSSSTIRS